MHLKTMQTVLILNLFEQYETKEFIELHTLYFVAILKVGYKIRIVYFRAIFTVPLNVQFLSKLSGLNLLRLTCKVPSDL